MNAHPILAIDWDTKHKVIEIKGIGGIRITSEHAPSRNIAGRLEFVPGANMWLVHPIRVGKRPEGTDPRFDRKWNFGKPTMYSASAVDSVWPLTYDEAKELELEREMIAVAIQKERDKFD